MRGRGLPTCGRGVNVLRAADPHTAVLGRVPGSDTYRDVSYHDGAVTFPGLVLFRFDAALFFANAPTLRDRVLALVEAEAPTTVVLDLESVDDVDSTGAQVLGELLDELDRRGVGLELARVRTDIRDELREAGVEQRLAGAGIHLEVDDAVRAHLARASEDGPPAPGDGG